MRWLNEPPAWAEADGVLSVTTGERTDFWRETHYGFIRDDGHLRYQAIEGDFSAELAFSGDYRPASKRASGISAWGLPAPLAPEESLS